MGKKVKEKLFSSRLEEIGINIEAIEYEGTIDGNFALAIEGVTLSSN